MNITTIWAIVTAAYGLAGVAAVGVFVAVLRRARAGTETWLLLSSLLALALHYGSAAADAMARTAPGAGAEWNIWNACSTAFLNAFWAFLVLFLAVLVKGRLELSTPERFSVNCWLGFAVFSLISAGVTVGRLAWWADSGTSVSGMQEQLARWSSGGQLGIFVLLAPIGLWTMLVRLVPKPERPALASWLAGERQLVSLQIAPGSERAEREVRNPLTASNFRALSSIVAVSAAIFIRGGPVSDAPWDYPVVMLLLSLSLLASLLGVIYYQARLTFFDILLKQGLLFALTAISVGLLAYLLLPALAGRDAAPAGAAFCLVVTIFVWCWSRVTDQMGRMMDRLLFGRPDYRSELRRLTEAMAKCRSAEEIGAMVPARLRELMRTESAGYGQMEADGASVVVRIGAAERVRGYLFLGDRERGQPYGSEDLTFLDAVASQFSAQLESLEARRAEELAATAELRALRAQINPHFLFNTLNTVAAMARSSPEAERTILNLARVFRNALDATRRERIALREELAGVRAFLEIEAARFEEKLRFTIDAPEELLDAQVPPLLVQPLVENAVKHGIGEKPGGGSVTVRVERCAEGVRVWVVDNGVGFDAGKMVGNVGLANVRERVEREGGRWELASTPGEGTAISFVLRLERADVA